MTSTPLSKFNSIEIKQPKSTIEETSIGKDIAIIITKMLPPSTPLVPKTAGLGIRG